MVSKKQYLFLASVAVIVFFATFVGVYLLSNMIWFVPSIDNVATVEEHTETAEDNQSKAETKDAFYILPSTEVMMVLKDQDGNIVDTELIDPYAIMGRTEQELLNIFPDYSVVAFNEQQVILEGSTFIEPQQVLYYLGVKDNNIGIVLDDDEFLELGLEAKEFSSYVNTFLTKELIPVTVEEKVSLQENPYYIEMILQNILGN